DVRTITMGISLLDCADSDNGRVCDKIYDKICRKAEHLVEVGNDISRQYGIPIINKRVSVTPIAMLHAACGGDPVKLALALQRAADTVQNGFAPGDLSLIRSIPEALARTNNICSSVNIGTTKAGINLDAVKLMGSIVKECSRMTADRDCIGAAKLVVLCNAPEDNPFMAGAFHGAGEPDCVINVGVSGPGVVRSAVSKRPEASINEIADVIKQTAFKITRMGQLVGTEASARLGVPFGIVDLSLAPTPAIGDSVAHILEEMGLESCGAYGTTACLAMLNDAVKKGGVMASSRVGGLSGAFIPVSEDAGMIAAVQCGSLSLEKLEAMTAVCSVGLDMIVIPGDTPDEIISAMIADEAAIGMVNTKTTAVRVIPAIGKKVGDMLEFGGLLGSGPVMKVNTFSPAKFINRGGHIPAPMQSLKN
ncbi:MAG: PFL family protein, partial [Angelakisella sp.]